MYHEVEQIHKGEEFDRNWIGPPELKPKVYRTQMEKDIWHGCVVDDEYRAPSLQPDDVVIDIGAHIGAFSYLAYLRGSRSIYAFEIDPWHVEAATVNLSDMRDGIGLYHSAVVRGDDKRAKEYHYDGAWNSFGLFGPTVGSFSLDEIITQVQDRVRFLKIDCEGGEWPILSTCKQLDQIDEIAGEYHIVPTESPEMRDLPIEVSEPGLRRFLEAKGFDVRTNVSGPTIGTFFAKRRLIPASVPASGETTQARLKRIAYELLSIAERS